MEQEPIKILHLSLKAKWYDMIRSGEKPEEYRNITPYWVQRLCWRVTMDADYDCDCEPMTRWAASLCCDATTLRSELAKDYIRIRPFTVVHFTLGYPKRDDPDRNMVRRIKEIVIGTGRPEWGAEPGKEYFVIKLED